MGIKNGIERVDTNIIVRMITQDNLNQARKARKLFSREDKIYVFESAAMMEVVYVLSGFPYHFSREQIASDIKSLMLLPNLSCNKSVIEGALDYYVSHPKLSFVDCYLAVMADITSETPLWTFDHKLASQCVVAEEL